jgi:hypothetical protein
MLRVSWPLASVASRFVTVLEGLRARACFRQPSQMYRAP